MELLYNERRIIFCIGFAILLVSIFFHAFKKSKSAVIFLLLASFFLFLYAAVSIPFLMPWDERLHALVSKNLMKHFLMPTLYDEELLDLPYAWIRAHIWVHKQPLFLWQDMLSFKIFGVNELALRLPGLLLYCAIVFASYRSGKLLGNHNIGYCTAFLIATSFFLYQLLSGYASLDQNDLVFMEYISLSIWTMTEYIYSGKKYWIVLTGIFSGFALLTKWITGLLVYLIWLLYTFFQHKWNFKKYVPLLFSFSITAIIAIPWQLFIFKNYPTEARVEYQHALMHFTTVLDGHEGPFTFYLSLIGQHFGSLVPYIILFAFAIFYFKSTDKKLSLSMIISIVAVYLFFSFAKTKMQSFTIIVALPVYLSVAFFINVLFDWVSDKLLSPPNLKIGAIALLFFILAVSRFDFNVVKADDGFFLNGDACFYALQHNKKIFQDLKLPDNAVLCNIPGYYYIDAMFYTGLPAYNFIPSESQYDELKEKKKRIALFMPADSIIPEYLKNDKQLILLHDTLKECE